jgi:hypothetical protein
VRSVGQKSNGQLENLFRIPTMAVLTAAADGSLSSYDISGYTQACRSPARVPAASGIVPNQETASPDVGRPSHRVADMSAVMGEPHGGGSAVSFAQWCG